MAKRNWHSHTKMHTFDSSYVKQQIFKQKFPSITSTWIDLERQPDQMMFEIVN